MHLGLGSYAFRWAIGTPAFRPEPYARAMTVHDLVDATVEEGLDLLQVADSAELDGATPDELEAVRAYASLRGVRLQTGFSGLTPANIVRQVGIAEAIGADLVRVVLDSGNAHPSRDESVGALRSALPELDRTNIAIAVENHFMTPSSEIVAIVAAIASPLVGVCLDTANSIMIGEWPEETIDLLAPYTLCLHLKDYRVVPDVHGVGGHVVGAPLGEGWLDVDSAIDALAPVDEHLNGGLAVILEQWLPLAETPEATLRAEAAARTSAVGRARSYLDAGWRTSGLERRERRPS